MDRERKGAYTKKCIKGAGNLFRSEGVFVSRGLAPDAEGMFLLGIHSPQPCSLDQNFYVKYAMDITESRRWDTLGPKSTLINPAGEYPNRSKPCTNHDLVVVEIKSYQVHLFFFPSDPPHIPVLDSSW